MTKTLLAAALAFLTLGTAAEAHVYIPRFPLPRPCALRPGCLPPRNPFPIRQIGANEQRPEFQLAQSRFTVRRPNSAVAGVRG